jgi:uncharacterized membrane-anchored protein
MDRLTAIGRVDRLTKKLIPRLRPGEIAVIDHTDLDGLSASGLVERRAAAVVNASPSISGRYPNRGPGLLMRAGVPLMDVSDPGLMAAVHEGHKITLTDQGVEVGDKLFAGRWLSEASVELALAEARSRLGSEIEAFARNTLEYIERERHLVLDNLDVPTLTTPIANRHAVVVVRGEGFKRDLEAILPYVREVRPVLIAVDGGADALLEYGLKPDLITGDMDSVSDAALRSGAEIVVHSYPRSRSASGPPDSNSKQPEPEKVAALAHSANGSGRSGTSVRSRANGADPSGEPDPSHAPDPHEVTRKLGCTDIDAAANAPGLRRLAALGLEGKLFSVAGTSEDMAMLIAYEKGAELIVAVGTHFGLVDFLEKGRAGMASTFLVRMRVASRLVDARGVGELYRRSSGLGYAWYLFPAAAFPIFAIAALSPAFRAYLELGRILLGHWFKHHGL